jgi:spoIIIJ-associated protein
MIQEKAQNIIKEIIEKIPIEKYETSFSYDESNKTLWCSVLSREPHFLIGKNGETLIALNHIARKILDRSVFEKIGSFEKPDLKIMIDINDYHKKKIENLKTTAHALSERAKFFKSNIETDPLSALERKIIHEFLAGRPNIKTESVGIEPGRKVLISYVSEK